MFGEDFSPVMKIAKNCHVLQDEAEQKSGEEMEKALVQANHEWGRMAEYVTPKLKATENIHSVEVKEISAEPELSEEDYSAKHGVESASGTTTRTD